MTYRIPFNKPSIVGKELYYIAQAVTTGHISGDGVFSKQCESLLEERFNARSVLLTTSCTAALEMAAMLCEIGPDDEVILPSYTFVSTANAFHLRGARLRFIDIREDTLNLNEDLLAEAIGPRAKAIVPVHYAGVGCEMDTILHIARQHDLLVVEDAAQAVDAKYKGRYLGCLGDVGTYSFHETKNFICGEGGALVTNTAKLAERAEILREKGTNRGQFFRGEVDKYTWVDIGSSYLPSDVLAAFLLAQLEVMDGITARRKCIYDRYYAALEPLAARGVLRLPVIPPDCESNYHMFYVILPDLDTRTKLIAHLKREGILAVFHYVPLHLSPVGRRMGYQPGDLPVTERLSDCLLRVPFYYELSDGEIEFVVSKIFSFFRVAKTQS